jgi:hypothetical protein
MDFTDVTISALDVLDRAGAKTHALGESFLS